MDLPKPKKGDTLESYWKRFTREQLPKGQAIRVKTKHSPKQGKNSRAVAFSLESDCKGPLAEAMELGLRLAKDAATSGDEIRAMLILDRLESLPREYELKAKLIALKAEQTRLLRAAG